MQITNAEIQTLKQHCSMLITRWQQEGATITLFRWATMELSDTLNEPYLQCGKKNNEIVKKYAEFGEDGMPKMKAKILDIRKKEDEQKSEILFKSDEDKEKCDAEIDALALDKVEIELPKYPIDKLLEQNIKFGTPEHFIISFIKA